MSFFILQFRVSFLDLLVIVSNSATTDLVKQKGGRERNCERKGREKLILTES